MICEISTNIRPKYLRHISNINSGIKVIVQQNGYS